MCISTFEGKRNAFTFRGISHGECIERMFVKTLDLGEREREEGRGGETEREKKGESVMVSNFWTWMTGRWGDLATAVGMLGQATDLQKRQ